MNKLVLTVLIGILTVVIVRNCHDAKRGESLCGYTPSKVVMTAQAAIDPYADAAKAWEKDYAAARQLLYNDCICIKRHKKQSVCDAIDAKWNAMFDHLNAHYPYPGEGKGWGNRESRMFDLALCSYNRANATYYYGFNPPIGDDPTESINNCLKYGKGER